MEEYSIYGRAVKIDCVLSIPSVSLPAGLASNDMPIGIMLYARPGALFHHASLQAILPACCVSPPGATMLPAMCPHVAWHASLQSSEDQG